jgi:hypothetical protein
MAAAESAEPAAGLLRATRTPLGRRRRPLARRRLLVRRQGRAEGLRVLPKYLCLTEGEWAGRPFVLQHWQEHDIVRPLFGWKRADGTRRYRRCFIWIPRKNGKTEFAAGLMLLMLLGDAEPGGQVFSIASEKDQASIVFNKATTWWPTRRSSASSWSLKTSIYCPQLNASIRPLSGKPKGKHGLNMSGLIGDEIHEWKSGDLYTFVHDSGAARRQPLEVLISTAGVKGTHGEEVWDECQAILAGDIDAPDTLVVVYAANEDDDWTDPERPPKANPNYGVGQGRHLRRRLQAGPPAAAPGERLQALPPQHVDRAGGPLAADGRGRRRRPPLRLGSLRRRHPLAASSRRSSPASAASAASTCRRSRPLGAGLVVPDPGGPRPAGGAAAVLQAAALLKAHGKRDRLPTSAGSRRAR